MSGTSIYLFNWQFQHGVMQEKKEMTDFFSAVQYCIDNIEEAQQPGLAVIHLGELKAVSISFDNITLADMPIKILQAVATSVKYSNETDGHLKLHTLILTLGADNFMWQTVKLLGVLSDIFLNQFNTPDKAFSLPVGYLSTADAKRDLQYLAEFCKIAQYQLAGDPARSW